MLNTRWDSDAYGSAVWMLMGLHTTHLVTEAYDSLVRDILTHVFMHSAYHRGQIASDMRQAGFVPAYTDFIHGVRQGLVE